MEYFKKIKAKYGQIAAYGLSMSLLLFLLKWLQWKFVILDHSLDIYIGLIAILFTILGIWVAKQLSIPKVKTVVIEKEVIIPSKEEFTIDEARLKDLGLTAREWDVLQLMAVGKSNAEIAETLFLSVSTVKTHASNVFVKLEVKSRTQAMEKAKRLKIIP
jgi:NarL family two-component system response regulator LiaR